MERMVRVLATGLVALVLLGASVGAVAAHAPDPALGGEHWAQDQEVTYRWRSGQVPPEWLQRAIHAAADDSNATRASRAAIFSYDADARSLISYGEPTNCGVRGIACFSRANAPVSFAMWFRRHGHVFDWGTLRWCQAQSEPSNGCFDAENVALDEFGHVQILGHHDNLGDESDYLDAVVQTISRTRPEEGWDAHAYGRCDVATLQREYGITWSTRVSTCLPVSTDTTLGVDDASVAYRAQVAFTAQLKVETASAYERLSGSPLSRRRVLLQRRYPGGTSWTTLAEMAAGSAGTYTATMSPSATAEWRAWFASGSDDGARSSGSSVITVRVAACTGVCPTGRGR
jgi:hypothetical protein